MKIDSEKLIELVKQYKILYDYNDKNYCDTEKKEDVWRQIGRKLNVPGKECKKNWCLLRDAYRRVLKRVSDASSEQVQLRRKWKHEDEMAFVLPYLKRRSRLTNVDVKPEAIDRECDEADAVMDNPIASPESSMGSIPSRENSPEVEENSTPKRMKLDTISDAEESTTFMLIKYLIDNQPRPKSSIDMLFDYLSATVQKFPVMDQIIVKKRVFEIVSAMEMEILTRSTEDVSKDNKEF